MKKRTKKITLVATAITTLLSATVAIAAISLAKKACTANDELKEENSEFKTVLDGLVNVGTITRAQEGAIRSALITAQEAAIANGEIPSRENGEHEAIPDASKTGTFTRIKKSIFRVRSQQLKKPIQKMAI